MPGPLGRSSMGSRLIWTHRDCILRVPHLPRSIRFLQTRLPCAGNRHKCLKSVFCSSVHAVSHPGPFHALVRASRCNPKALIIVYNFLKISFHIFSRNPFGLKFEIKELSGMSDRLVGRYMGPKVFIEFPNDCNFHVFRVLLHARTMQPSLGRLSESYGGWHCKVLSVFSFYSSD